MKRVAIILATALAIIAGAPTAAYAANDGDKDKIVDSLLEGGVIPALPIQQRMNKNNYNWIDCRDMAERAARNAGLPVFNYNLFGGEEEMGPTNVIPLFPLGMYSQMYTRVVYWQVMERQAPLEEGFRYCHMSEPMVIEVEESPRFPAMFTATQKKFIPFEANVGELFARVFLNDAVCMNAGSLWRNPTKGVVPLEKKISTCALSSDGIADEGPWWEKPIVLPYTPPEIDPSTQEIIEWLKAIKAAIDEAGKAIDRMRSALQFDLRMLRGGVDRLEVAVNKTQELLVRIVSRLDGMDDIKRLLEEIRDKIGTGTAGGGTVNDVDISIDTGGGGDLRSAGNNVWNQWKDLGTGLGNALGASPQKCSTPVTIDLAGQRMSLDLLNTCDGLGADLARQVRTMMSIVLVLGLVGALRKAVTWALG